MSSITLKARSSGRGTQHFKSVSETAYEKIRSELQNNSAGISPAQVGKVVSMEGMDDAGLSEVNQSLQALYRNLDTIACESYTEGKQTDSAGKAIESKHTKVQIQAASVAALYAQNAPAFLRAGENRTITLEKGEVLMPVPPSGIDRLKASLEAYDEKENRNVALYSATFNMMAAHQDEFGETLFPTVVVPVDQTGFSIATRLTRVIDDIRRNPDGSINQLKDRNIIQAVIDPTILRSDITNIVPVVRVNTAQWFVPSTAVAPASVLVDNQPVMTAPLAIGKEFSLLGVSQTDAMLANGTLDITDAIDTAVTLQALYLQITNVAGTVTEVIKLNTGDLPFSAYNYQQQDNFRNMVLGFNSESLQINKNTKKADGTASTLLAALVAADAAVRLGVRATGTVNLQTANNVVDATIPRVVRVSKLGVDLDPTAGEGKTYADMFAGATIIGYDLKARRTNSNLRQRGQLLDNTWSYQTYPIPIGAPISILHPMGQGDANDAADLAALITAARITTSNAAVTALLAARDTLAQHVNNNDGLADAPVVFGAASKFVKAYFVADAFDALLVVDSIKSSERARDIQGGLLNFLRSHIYAAYRDSGYKAAADARAGGPAPTPTVIIATDTVIARWIMVEGDMRTIGPDFNVKVVSTLDQRMKGKIFITFGNFDGQNQGVPDYLHFGNMGWRPELALTLPISRNGQVSKELVVQPSFVHVAHLPVLVEIDVTNLEAAAETKIIISTTP